VRECLHDRMARAPLRRLQRPDQVVACERARNRVAAMAIDHNDSLWLERPSLLEHMGEKRTTRKRMQHLG